MKIKINLLKVLHTQIMSERGRKTEQAYSVRFYFLITSQYYSEANEPITN